MNLETSRKINKYILKQQSEYHKFILERIAFYFAKHPMKDIRLKSKCLIDDIQIKRDIELNELEKFIMELKEDNAV